MRRPPLLLALLLLGCARAGVRVAEPPHPAGGEATSPGPRGARLAAPLAPSRRPAPLPPIAPVKGSLAIRVVYPRAGGPPIASRDSNFLFGSVGSGDAELTINGASVAVAPNGAFLAWLPLPDDSVARFRLLARRGGDSVALSHRVRLPARWATPAARLWLDPSALQPRGNRWAEPGELIRVAARAAPGGGGGGTTLSLRLPDGRLVPLAPDTLTLVEPGASGAGARAGRYVGVFAATPLGAPLPTATTPEVRPAPRDSALNATVLAVLGPDTVQAALPLRLTLLPPAERPVVVLDDDTARSGATDHLVPGRPGPGGTLYWFFPNGTPAAVSGRWGDALRLQLSGGSSAWVGIGEVAAVLPAGTPPPSARLALVRLAPGAGSVVARLVLSARVPFLVDEEDAALTLRLYGASSDLDFVQYGGTDPLVRRVTWAQPSAEECTVRFELASGAGGGVWGWRTRWEGADLVLEIRRPPVINAARPLLGRTIAVDPGHPPLGATGPTGLTEAEANLAIALRLRDILVGQGAQVVLTREGDSAVAIYRRTTFAEEQGAELLVSIHNNAFPDGVNPFPNHGTSVYYFHPRSTPLAFAVQEALVGELGLRNLGLGRGDLALARPTWMPAVLTEGAFLMIPEQEHALRTPAFQEAYARGVALGIERFLRERARGGGYPATGTGRR